MSLAWFALAAVLAIAVLWNVSTWYKRRHLDRPLPSRDHMPASSPVSSRRVAWSVFILLMLIFSKYFYLASLTSYYTFFLISKFHVSVRNAQLHLFVFLAAVAAGSLVGGPIGDRIGRKLVIWWSILGTLPFTLLLPSANLFWTGILTVIIGLVLSSAFSAILVYGQELIPGKVGAMSGLFFGVAFGMGGIGAAVLGKAGRCTGIDLVYRLCAFSAADRRDCRVPSEPRTPLVSPSDRLTHHLILLVTQYGLLIVGINVLLDQIGLAGRADVGRRRRDRRRRRVGSRPDLRLVGVRLRGGGHRVVSDWSTLRHRRVENPVPDLPRARFLRQSNADPLRAVGDQRLGDRQVRTGSGDTSPLRSPGRCASVGSDSSS